MISILHILQMSRTEKICILLKAQNPTAKIFYIQPSEKLWLYYTAFHTIFCIMNNFTI